jgi:hypothetical protein
METAVTKLCASEDLSDVEEGGSLLDKLLMTMVHDSSPEVRRATVISIPVNEQTMFNLIDRTDDMDVGTRKALYSSILPRVSPQDLSMAQWEAVVRKGLGERELIEKRIKNTERAIKCRCQIQANDGRSAGITMPVSHQALQQRSGALAHHPQLPQFCFKNYVCRVGRKLCAGDIKWRCRLQANDGRSAGITMPVSRQALQQCSGAPAHHR